MGAGWVLLVAIVVGLSTLAIFLFSYLHQHRKARREQKGQFHVALVHRLAKLKANSQFSFAEFVTECDVPRSLADNVAGEVYEKFCGIQFQKMHVSNAERNKLDSLCKFLELPARLRQSIEEKCGQKQYQLAVASALADGVITEAEATELEQIRKNLGLSRSAALESTYGPAREGYVDLLRNIVSDRQITSQELEDLSRYRAALAISEPIAKHMVEKEAIYRDLFRRVIWDGKITAEEIEQMNRFRQALTLSEREASEIIRKDAFNFFRECFAQIVQNGDVSPADEQKLVWLQDFLGLPSAETHDFWVELSDVKRLGAYRNGDLPSVRSAKLLEGGEICHWEGECRYVWTTSTKELAADGELLVTSNRLIFASPRRSFEFGPHKIVDIVARSDGLRIQTSGNRGNGLYYASRARDLEAVLYGLVRKHKFLLAESYSSSISRHIPDAVKRTVWDRDGGRCVRCREDDYLEFDHIIPRSRGGANTVNNVQLLCRRCNSLKSDRI